MAKTADKVYIYGKHALVEALSNRPEVVKKVFLSSQAATDPDLVKLVKKTGIAVSALGGGKDEREITDNAAHQGVIALIEVEKLVVSYDTFKEKIKATSDTAFVVLGEVQDPHNVGAIIRSAAAFGISGVLIPEHNQAPITGAVVKVSAGMAFRVPLISIGNVNTTLRDLKDRGFWIYGLAGEGKQSLTEEKFDAPTVFVVGNEADGLREKTRVACDVLLSIPINPKCESLNAAVSTAVALYAWSVKHPQVLSLTK